MPVLVNTSVMAPSMSETELLRMPARDYMNEAQLAFFWQCLKCIEHDLRLNSEVTGEHLRAVDVAADPADRATQEEEQAIELRSRDRERKLLKKIAQALARVEAGTYGWCEETGDAIGLRRLLARPTATLCIEAQERREKMERVYGG